MARSYRHRGLSLDELVASGNLGLLEAARRFDPDRGAKFTTYAAWWIRKAMLLALARHEPGTVSLDEPASDDSSEARSSRVPDRSTIDAESALLVEEATRRVRDAVVALSPLGRTVLEHRFGLDDRPVLSLRDTGVLLGLCGERVRQIERRSLEELRRALHRTPHHLRPTVRPMRSAVSRSNLTASVPCGLR
jgi:RNA polymerase primary sigma factor